MKGPQFRSKAHFFHTLDMPGLLVPESPDESSFTGTKLIATLGPACQDVGVLVKMLDAGMTAGRIDLAWGSLEYHQKSLTNLQQASLQAKRMCATILDLLGREITVRRSFVLGEDGWPKHGSPIKVKAGQTITLTTDPEAECTDTLFPVTYKKLDSTVNKGDTIHIGRYLVSGADQASLYLEVQEVKHPEIVCVSKNDATLDGLLTVFVTERADPMAENKQSELPLVSDYDKMAIKTLSSKFEVDYIFAGPVRGMEDITALRAYLDSIGLNTTAIVAKIETREALVNIKGILSEADAVVLSRGNLGLDCAPEKMALIQKAVTQYCNMVGKPVIVTRVVDTMVSTPRPTRAEATDVANIVLDGADAVLLGAETLRGMYPVEAITTIASICRQAEKVFDYKSHFEHLMTVALETQSLGSFDSSMNSPADGMSPASSVSDGLHTLGYKSGYHSSQHSLAARAIVNDGMRPNNASYSSLNNAIFAMTRFSAVGSAMNLSALEAQSGGRRFTGSPYLSKLESIASSAVRAADKVNASLIVVYTHTGKTAQLVAKYRPTIPILTLVVPHLVSDNLKWRLEGRSNARQCLLSRGLLPVLAAPASSGDKILEEAVRVASGKGLVAPHDHVVVVQRIHDDFCIKIIGVDGMGLGIKRLSNHSHSEGDSLDTTVPASPTTPSRSRSKINRLTVPMFDHDSMLSGSLISASPGKATYIQAHAL